MNLIELRYSAKTFHAIADDIDANINIAVERLEELAGPTTNYLVCRGSHIPERNNWAAFLDSYSKYAEYGKGMPPHGPEAVCRIAEGQGWAMFVMVPWPNDGHDFWIQIFIEDDAIACTVRLSMR